MKINSFIPFLSFLFMVSWFISYPVSGQENTKKQVTEEDYQLWGNLHLKDISPDGKWVSYTMSYESGADTLFVKNINDQKTFQFVNHGYSMFYPNQWFACKTTKGLEILNLKNRKATFIPDIVSFEFDTYNEHLLLLSQEGVLTVRTPGNEQVLFELSHIKEFKVNPVKNQFAYVQQNDLKGKVSIMEIKENPMIKEIATSDNGSSFQGLTWGESGEALAFYKEQDMENSSLLFYQMQHGKLFELNPKEFPEFRDGNIATKGHHKLIISNDLSKIFFSLEFNVSNVDNTESQVQVWNTRDRYTYLQKKLWESPNPVYTAVWFPEEKRISKITTDELPKIFLTGDKNYAVLYNPKKYEPQYAYHAPLDFHIINLQTSTNELILEKYSGYLPYTLPSPKGKYIAYFQKGGWWLYDLKNKVHKNITPLSDVKWENDINDSQGESQAYGIAGWACNDDLVFLYDEFDIWKVNIENGTHERLTKGKEKNIRFRIANADNNSFPDINFDGWLGKELNPEKGILINAHGDDASSGYYLWTNTSRLQEIIYHESKIDQMLDSNGVMVWREQRYDTAPKMVSISKNRKAKTIFQSNPHQEKYLWGRSEPISYKISNGKILKGILYYPAGFDPAKKYPMIVSVYEKQFQNLHQYITPEKYSTVGFNVSNYTTDGYFLLFPDIEYEIGKTGISATDCVVSAVNKIKELEYINPEKIGLIGHSFGGYETNFIITKTDIFAAAISGAGVGDLVSLYLNLNWITGKPDIWRMESQQWRIGQSLFEDRNLYYENSPVSYAENVKTPLLSWTGQEDYQVNWHQSILWYLALRRLNKEHILLIYPKEEHALLKSENQIDLSIKIKDWFGYYLKDEAPADWIVQKN
ncbi:MAG TPA: prolyl oligopeptidase family serine peptidase [Moheibacter sp.]|nr:prolyl oligopeptidase family serine peptidase [Moheibacter sp.]